MKNIISIAILFIAINLASLYGQKNINGGRYINPPVIGEVFELELDSNFKDNVDLLLWYSKESKYILLSQKIRIEDKKIKVFIPNCLEAGNYYKFFIRDKKGGLNALNNNFVCIETRTKFIKNSALLYNAINVFPTPTTDILNIEVGNDTYDRIRIFNSNGSFINQLSFTNQLNVSNLTTGIYLLSLEANDKVKTIKFIVTK